MITGWSTTLVKCLLAVRRWAAMPGANSSDALARGERDKYSRNHHGKHVQVY